MNKRAGWRETAGLIVLFVLALAIRVAILDSQGLWADEVFSLAIATGHSLEQPAAMADPARGDFIEGGIARPAAEWNEYLDHGPQPQTMADVIRAVRLSDTNPPLYYLLLHYWTRTLGTSDRALKAFSIFFSLAAFPLIASLARRLGGQAAVLPACALYAFAPACLYYSTEGRMYSLCWLWVVAVADVTLAWRESRRPLAPALAWITISLAGLYTHYFFVFAWLPLLMGILLHPGRARRTWILTAVAAVIFLATPWYATIGDHMNAWRVTSGWLGMKPKDWWFPEALTKAFLGHLSGQGIWGGGRRDNILTLMALAACFLTDTIRWRTRAFSWRRALIWVWLAAPVAGVVLMDAWQGTFALNNYRYVSMGLPAAVLILATTLAQWSLRLRWSVLVIVFLFWVPRIATIANSVTRCGSPFRQVGQELSDRVHPDGVVIAHSIPSGVLGIARYSRPDLEIAAWVEQLGHRKDSDLARIVKGRTQVLLARVHEVWMNDRVDRLLEDSARLVRDEWRWTFRLLEFTLLDEPADAKPNHPEE